MSINLLQQLNTVSNPGGAGIPVQQYAQELQAVLTKQLTSVPNAELSTLSTTQSALSGLQSALQQLQSATDTLAAAQTWDPVTVTSSNTSSFTATAGTGAQPGTYTISVTSLAQNQLNASQSGWQTSSTGTSTLSAGTFSVTNTASGNAASISVTSGESLSQIAAAVNQSTTTTGVEASVINNGNATTPYQLVFESVNTGTNSAFTLADTSGNLISTQLNAGTATQAATNAAITLDGTVNLSSQSNQFTNAIPGITLNIVQNNTSGTLTVTQNASAITSAVQTWMNAYNAVVDLVNQGISYTPSTGGSTQNGSSGTAGPLFSDPNANALLAQLPTAVNAIIGGLPGGYNSLSSIGIVVDPSTGHLEFQPSGGFSGASGTLQDGQTLFQNALAANPSAVQQLFGVVQTAGATSAVPTSGVLGSLTGTLNNFLGSGGSTGSITSDLNSIQNQQSSINSYLTQVNQQIASQVADFTAQLNALNASMQQSQMQMQALASLISGASAASSSSTPIL